MSRRKPPRPANIGQKRTSELLDELIDRRAFRRDAGDHWELNLPYASGSECRHAIEKLEETYTGQKVTVNPACFSRAKKELEYWNIRVKFSTKELDPKDKWRRLHHWVAASLARDPINVEKAVLIRRDPPWSQRLAQVRSRVIPAQLKICFFGETRENKIKTGKILVVNTCDITDQIFDSAEELRGDIDPEQWRAQPAIELLTRSKIWGILNGEHTRAEAYRQAVLKQINAVAAQKAERDEQLRKLEASGREQDAIEGLTAVAAAR